MDTKNTRSPRQSAPQVGASTSGLLHLVLAAGIAVAVSAPVAGLGAWMIREGQQQRRAELAAVEAEQQAHERLVAGAPGAVVDATVAAHGREVFMTACVACHGASGVGVAGLGKNLVESDFVALQSDEALRAFILKGRTGPVGLMPAKGGREDLTDADIGAVAVYLRGLQDPRRMPALPEYVAAKPAPVTADEKAAALAAAGGDEELAAFIASGRKIYSSTCIACHGKEGTGIQGNGKALANNPFVQSLDDDALLAFVQSGRAPTDPKNTTGIQMPPKGGNPALNEDDLLDVISYLRTLQPQKTASGTGR